MNYVIVIIVFINSIVNYSKTISFITSISYNGDKKTEQVEIAESNFNVNLNLKCMLFKTGDHLSMHVFLHKLNPEIINYLFNGIEQ